MMVYCSFCGKSQEEVKKIIAGNNAFICNECVELAQEIIREELADVYKRQELIQAGHQVVVVDNLVNSNRKSLEVVERITGVAVSYTHLDVYKRQKV